MHHSSDLYRDVYTGRRKRLGTTRLVGLIVVVFVAVFGLFFGGEYLQRLVAYQQARDSVPDSWALTLDRPARDIVSNVVPELPISWIPEKLLTSGLPVYDLRMRTKDLDKLQRTAEQVTARSIATDIPRDYVSAEFLVDGKWVPIKVKLRGKYYPHYHKRQPSLRLKFPRNQLFKGQRQINLSHPYDKGLTEDVTANWELRRRGILTWNSQFVVLRLNGEVVGVFQEIEHFTRSISDRNGRSEGYIFSGEGQLFGKEGPAYAKAHAAMELLKGCGELDGAPLAEYCDWQHLGDYFDMDKMAWAGALTFVLNTQHAWAPDNLRLFWDPARGKFEPVPWDYGSSRFDPNLHPEGERPLSGYRKTFYGMPEYRRMRDRRAWILLTERVDAMIEYADALFDTLAKPLTYDMRYLGLPVGQSRHTRYVNDLRDNRKFLTELFHTHDLRAQMWRNERDNVIFSLENYGKSFLAVNAIIVSDGVSTHFQSLNPVIVDGLWFGEPGEKRFSVAIPQNARVVGLAVQNEVTGAKLQDDEITLSSGPGSAPELNPPAAPPALHIALQNTRTEVSAVTFGPGRVVLDKTLEIPSSHEVIFAPGLELSMSEGVSLIVYGNFTSIGTEESPVKIFGADSRNNWGGIFVQGSPTHPGAVRMQYTTFHGGVGGETARSLFTSPFSVHDGVIDMRFCRFFDSAADDGINLKYAEVNLQNNLVQNSTDDAVDCDFCKGKIVDNSVVNAGGDGFDFSGSDVVVESNTVTQCGDKGVSIGERTKATLIENVISECKTGIAVKDSSDAVIRNGQLSQLQVGIALYMKKPTFGPSRATLEGVTMDAVGAKLVRDRLSTLDMSKQGPSYAVGMQETQ